MPLSVPGRVAAPRPPAAVLRGQPGEPGGVPHRPDRVRVQVVQHRRPFQEPAGAAPPLRRARRERQAAAAGRVAAQPRDGGRGEPDHAAGGAGGAGGGAGPRPRLQLQHLRRAQGEVPAAPGRRAAPHQRRPLTGTRQ